MSVKWMALAAVVVLAAAAEAQQRQAFKDSRERISYALGVEAGQQFMKRGIDLDGAAFARALEDVLAKRTPQLTDAQVRAAIAELQANLKRREFDARSARGEAERQAAAAFLAANKTEEGVVTLASGLQYRILTPGHGPRPTDRDTVVCRYRGTLINGMEFDSSSRGASSSTFKVGEIIAGLREALALMPVGSKWQVFVPPALASGSPTATMTIPPNQALVYELELVAIR